MKQKIRDIVDRTFTFTENPHSYDKKKKREVGTVTCLNCKKQVEMTFTVNEYCKDCLREKKIQESWC